MRDARRRREARYRHDDIKEKKEDEEKCCCRVLIEMDKEDQQREIDSGWLARTTEMWM